MTGPSPVFASASEAEWQAYVVDFARFHGWRVAHFRPAQLRSGGWVTPVTGDVGFPDLVLAHERRGVVFAELKSARGRTSAGQDEWIRVLRSAGSRVFLWRPADVEGVEAVLKGVA